MDRFARSFEHMLVFFATCAQGGVGPLLHRCRKSVQCIRWWRDLQFGERVAQRCCEYGFFCAEVEVHSDVRAG